MTKKLKIYQVLTFALGLAFVGLCLFVGITAVQKSMKLNLLFDAKPSILVKIELYNATTSQYDVIFQNDGTGQIGEGLRLNGNTLSFTESFESSESLGASFDLRITNLMTDTDLKATVSGTGATSDPTYVIMKAYSENNTDDTKTITVSGNSSASTLQLSFEKYVVYSIYAIINGTEQQIGEYSPKSSSQEVDITYTDFYGLGDLMSAVVGVSEVTATQITIAANTTGPITIVPKGYTIGTYVDTDSTIFTPNTGGENTIEYEAFKDYKYLQFNHTNSNTYSKRWIIIGGGKSETTTYGTGAAVKADSLESNQLLLLSEKLIENQYYDNNVYTSFTNYHANKRGLYYQSDVRYLCRTYTKEEGSNDNLDMSAYTSRMAQKTIQTSWNYTSVNCNETYNDNGNVNTTDYMFLLAYDVNNSSYARYAEQEFLITNYLGSSSSDARRICYNSSNSASYWWLRSGLCDDRNRAYYVDRDGLVHDYDVRYGSLGVRPSFILNLA